MYRKHRLIKLLIQMGYDKVRAQIEHDQTVVLTIATNVVRIV